MRYLAAVLLTLLAGPALAATTVIGNISPNTPALTHWTVGGSPYNVTGDATVQPNTTLTIDPGVTVVVSASDASQSGVDASHVELVINGGLQANGTATNPIVIQNATRGANNWVGITLNAGAAASSMSFTSISDAKTALQVLTGNSPTTSDVTISQVTNGVVWQSAATADLDRFNITNFSGTAVAFADDGANGLTAMLNASTLQSGSASSTAVSVAARVSGSVTRNLVVMNGTGVNAAGGSSLTLENCVIAGNASAGVVVNQTGSNAVSIINNTIDQNFSASVGIGLNVTAVSSASAFIVRNNIVTNNGTGISVSGSTAPSLDSNDVWNNGGNNANYSGVTAGAHSISTNPLFLGSLGTTPSSSAGWQTLQSSTSCEPYYNGPNLDCGDFTQPGAGWIQVQVSSGREESITVKDRNGTTVSSLGASQSMTVVTIGNAASVAAYCAYYQSDPSYYCYGTVAASYLPLSYDYHVQPSSPVIDTGNNLGAATNDLDGASRPYNATQTATATVDMGAYEYHANIPPTAVFGQGSTVLINTPVNFDGSASFDPDGHIASWDWDFGDGSPHGIGETATHNYTATGMFTVTLTVTDNANATGTSSATETVVMSLPPVAKPGSPQVVSLGAPVTLDGSASYQPNGTIVAYQWDFGDNTPDANNPVVTHTYMAVGTYTATLTVTSNFGAMASATVDIGVSSGGMTYPPPVADPGGPYSGGISQVINFDGSHSSATMGTINSYAWDFGDGNMGSGPTPTHAYASAGGFLVNLTVTDSHGGTATASALVTISAPNNTPPVANPGGPYSGLVGHSVSFDGSRSTATMATITTFSWDFGDGNSGTGEMPTHTYALSGSFLVTLTVTDTNGDSANASTLANVTTPTHTAPTANAGGSKQGTVGVAIIFDASASTAASGSRLVSYAWDFGDGATSTMETISHTYATAGSYLVKLTVTDDASATDQDTVVASITSMSSNMHPPPVADAGQNVTANAGQMVTLSAAASTDSDGTITTYLWDFGDGNTGIGLSTTHAYAMGGSFTITLTVSDSFGNTDTAMITATIYELPVPNAGGNRQGTVGVAMTFDASASTVAHGTITNYSWEFGDGAVGTGAMTTHTYTQAGTFNVTLTVTDDKGGQASVIVTAAVAAAAAAPAPTATTRANSGCSSPGEAGLLALMASAIVIRRRRTAAR